MIIDAKTVCLKIAAQRQKARPELHGPIMKAIRKSLRDGTGRASIPAPKGTTDQNEVNDVYYRMLGFRVIEGPIGSNEWAIWAY